MKNALILFSILLFSGSCANGEMKNDNLIHHKVNVRIEVEQSKIKVDNYIDLSGLNLSENQAMQFSLNKNLVIDSCNYTFEKLTSEDSKEWNAYSIKNANPNKKLFIRYAGVIADQKEKLSAPPKHGASKETSGIVFEKGIYLSGTTAWVPRFKNIPLVTFEIKATVSKEWNVVAQGEELSNKIVNDRRQVVYKSSKPTNQIYLLGNKWTKYSIKSGAVSVQAYLINADEQLANKYMSATSQYLKMYEKLIGEYPYSKFALVENFWETGYGMPSFTLLGQRVIRMPWIISSSYPHELLHNYWGNSVFVDYSKGNWSEGITTYMADHLLKEMKGQGAEYRQSCLQKYSSYVNTENDFPVVDFKSRTTNASSAIGYDKVVMINHMLRVKYGEEIFLKAYADFYKTNRFQKVSFDEIRASFEKVTGDDLSDYFQQWTKRKGAPEIEVKNLTQEETNGKYKLFFTIVQTQNTAPFCFDLPISIFQKGIGELVKKTININKQSNNFTFEFDSEIERVEFDPEFDVMRGMDSKEVAVTLSGMLGAQKCTVVLPRENPNVADYQAMANAFKMKQLRLRKQVEIVGDDELETFPSTDYVLVLGEDNKFANKAKIESKLTAGLSSEVQKSFENNTGSLFYIQSVEEQKIAFMASKDTKQLTRIFMKMGHYGGYSFLGFEGAEGKNTIKGMFPILDSPMIFNLNRTIDLSNYNTAEIKRSLLGEMQ
ncbi:MAG: hypothetical protein JEZ01_19160 [Labilibaculum sp.]|nr:M1 family aminopeptidase [Labilibaculum sp.]MBI9059892.1 hypothetical protein [Labilibaculum sp.]